MKCAYLNITLNIKNAKNMIIISSVSVHYHSPKITELLEKSSRSNAEIAYSCGHYMTTYLYTKANQVNKLYSQNKEENHYT